MSETPRPPDSGVQLVASTAATRAGAPADYYRNRMRRIREERRAAGTCIECGLCPPRPERESCQDCASAKKARAPQRDEIDDLIRSVAKSRGIHVVTVLADDSAVSAARRELVRLMTERGLSRTAIAHRLHLTPEAVRQHQIALGLHRRAA